MSKKNNSKLQLTLSVDELTHLRDLFSIVMPQEFSITLSESLALAKEEQSVENLLWKKIYTLCKDNNIPTDKDAHDFAVLPTMHPQLVVQQVSLEIEE